MKEELYNHYVCEWCKQKFNKGEEVFTHEDGVFHDDECFNEHLHEAYGFGGYMTIEEYIEDDLEFLNRINKQTNETPLKSYRVTIYDFTTHVLADNENKALTVAWEKSPYNDDALPAKNVEVDAV